MASVRTNFSPKDHGFKFGNLFQFSFKLDLPFAGPIDLGEVTYGLCGGMCFAALDYFHAGNCIPDVATVANVGQELRDYLWDRQLDSLSLPMGVMKVLEWMLREDEDVSRLTAGREFRKLRTRLGKGTPAVLNLIHVQGMVDPRQNHQVVANGYDYNETTKQLRIYLYDPNLPGKEPWLDMNFSEPSHGINATQSSGGGLRGFFVGNYRPRTPRV